MRMARAALIAVSAAGIFCGGCFGTPPDSPQTPPRADSGAQKQADEGERAEFPAAPPGPLDRDALGRAEWIVADPFRFPVLPEGPDEEDMTILGQPEATEKQMVEFIRRRNPAPSLTCSLEELVALYYEEAAREGVRADIALCQACKETGFFRYGGDVSPDQNNYCGLGATGKKAPGARFPSPAVGVRAHIQHLLVYATERRPQTDIVDPRYDLVTGNRPDIHGRVPTWTGLSGTWAVPGTHYGQDILSLWRQAVAPDGSPASLRQASEAVRRDPDDADAYIRRAVARYYAGETRSAIADCDVAIGLAPSAEAYYDRALAYEALDDSGRAEEDYTAALRLAPEFPQPWYNRGRLRLLRGDYSRALPDFARALALIPRLSDAGAAMGVAHAKQGDYEAAWNDFYTVTHRIHKNNEAALANQRILLDAVREKK